MKQTSHSKPSPSAAAPPLLRITNLRHSYKGRPALQGVALDVRAREIFGILGPNGSGKSTLFKILSTFLLPSAGAVTIAGENLFSNPMAVREKIGVVFQSFGLDKKLTVRENLLHQGHLYGMQGAPLEKRIMELLADFGLSERKKERVEVLSGGLQRRVEIAKGLLHGPTLLLLDEPSTGLDPGARLDLWKYLEWCRETAGTTVVLTTHLTDEADRCDRVAIFEQGTVVAEGTPQDLRREIGGDVVVLGTADPANLERKIRRRFKLSTQVVGDELHIEAREGHRLIPRLAEAFPGMIETMTIRKPTLEDVFIHKTGHRLWSHAPENGDGL